MPRGRPKKPTELKVVAGTARADRENPKAIKPKRSYPVTAPTFLSDYAKQEWSRISKELHEMGILSKLDRAAMATLCEAWARFRKASETLEAQAAEDPETGALIIKTAIGNVIQNPLIGIINKAAAEIRAISIEFGMTPAARSRVNGADPDDEKDPAAKYFD